MKVIRSQFYIKIACFLMILYVLSGSCYSQNLKQTKKKTSNPIKTQLMKTNSNLIEKNNLMEIKNVKINEDKILAIIGDKIITEDEFIRRAEYTIRPKYCEGNGGLEKKIVLNSLIAEKLIALEYGKDNELLKNEHYQRYILGRQDQAMRQLLYYNEAYKKVILDTNEIKKMFKIASRTYELKYFTVKDDSIAGEIDQKFKIQNKSFESIYKELTGVDNYPMARIDWKCKENEIIMKALFSDTLSVNQLISPLKIDDTTFMFIQIKGWTYRPTFSEKASMERWNEVSDKLKEEKSYEVYEKFISNVMRGKRINFFREAFLKYIEIVAPLYLKNKKENDEIFLYQTFDRPVELPSRSEIIDSLQCLQDKPIFEVDGKIWNVRELQSELERHPLVFRKRKIKNSEFGENLKLAIVDMVRDGYLAQIAYEKGYNQLDIIKNNIEMWKDAEFAIYWKYKYLKKNNIEEKDMNRIIKRHLKPFIDTLQKKYSDKIKIDIDKFNKIRLTRTPMFATQKNVPFPIIVPSFPQLTNDDKLDYGKKIEKNKIN